jgi:hypothetical protein
LPQKIRDLEEQAGPFFNRSPAPAFESFKRRFHGGLNVLFPRFLVYPNRLRRLRGINRSDIVGSFDSPAADNEIVFASQLPPNFGYGRAHLTRIVRAAEIGSRFVNEFSVMRTNSIYWGRFQGCHQKTSMKL